MKQRIIGALLMLAGISGCGLPHMIWSPDGKQAGYLCNKQAVVIDENGAIVAELGASTGGFAWSSDSKTLYFATQDKSTPATQSTTRPAEKFVIASWSEGKVTQLAQLPEEVKGVAYLLLSPDQNWLAIMGAKEENWISYILELKTQKLTLLADKCSHGMCFTGPNRVAIVTPDVNMPADSGTLEEVVLNSEKKSWQTTPLLRVLTSQTNCIHPAGDELIFVTEPVSYPGTINNKLDCQCNLYQWTRANREVAILAEDVGPLFMASPDGKRILYQKRSAGKDSKRSELAVMNANGSNSHVLSDLNQYKKIPMWPTWRGNEQIVFVEPMDAKKAKDANGRIPLEVILYHLDEQGKMEAVRTLSAKWPAELKPPNVEKK
jgi:Tol biopolymer transport system component